MQTNKKKKKLMYKNVGREACLLSYKLFEFALGNGCDKVKLHFYIPIFMIRLWKTKDVPRIYYDTISYCGSYLVFIILDFFLLFLP